MSRIIKVVITSGDPDGIGLEVISKALARLKPKPGVQLYLWRSPSAKRRDLNRIDSYFNRATVASWPEALKAPLSGHKDLVDISSRLSPAHWVEISAQAAKLGHVDALATAPLSKTTIQKSGLNDIGHTDILKRVTGARDCFMCFVGKKFSVVLATGHVSVDSVQREFSANRLESAINSALELKRLLPNKDRRKIAVVGLDPHAGEDGLIGDTDKNLIVPIVSHFQKRGLPVEGPLVPDAAFLEENWGKYCVYVAAYHDQGLIPYKLVHKRQGVHITMGLPFIRTSVDHGTAKDIFGKNKADYQSMLEALKWAIDLSRSRKGDS